MTFFCIIGEKSNWFVINKITFISNGISFFMVSNPFPYFLIFFIELIFLSILDLFSFQFDFEIGHLVYNSILVLIYAYLFRFIAVAYNSIEGNTLKIGNNLSESSYLLGYGKIKTFFKIDFPLLRSALLSSFILVLIDVMKELPLTLILKPYNLSTLAVRAYEYAEDERVAEAALPALFLIFLIGTMITLLNYKLRENKQ